MPQSLRILAAALALFALLAADARGQRLLEVDGIELHGAAQLVQSGGGTCNVLETDSRYEEKQANHGAPMDIWRLDFTVRNGSGRWLDHLIARFQIASEWPECTNWDVPDAARLAVEYPSAIIEWGGSIGHIQESGRNVVSPGHTLTDTKLLIVLRGDPEPRFSNWSMDFNIAAAPPPPGAGSPAATPTGSAELDALFWQSIVNSENPADFEAYLSQFPSGVFRALAENRLAALRAPAAAGRPAVGAGAPAAGTVAPTDARPGPGDVFRDCAGCPEMVVIPAGSFRMGCVSGRDCYSREQPVHPVTISRPFALSRHEMTFDEYDRFAAATGRSRPDDEGWGRGRRPAVNVSWNDAQAYVSWLSAETGVRYRLPSEAEWEYAARAGTTTAYSWGNEIGSNRASCYLCGSQWDGEMTATVGSFGANAWGLHDMHGNVWEWVEDCWHETYVGAPADGSAWTAGGNCGLRVLRGGSWLGDPRDLRAASRYGDDAGGRNYDIFGFRVARTLD